MKKNWIDKNTLIIVAIIGVIFLGMLAVLWIKFVPKGDMVGPLVCSLIVFLGFVTQSHYLPLRVSDNLIYVASPQFPSIGRKAVELDKIKEIFIDDQYRSFDEGGKWSRGILLIVRVTDNSGKKYRNIIFRDSLPEFKKVIKEQGYNGLLSESGTGPPK